MHLSPALFHYHYSIFINDIYLTMRSYANVKLLKIVIITAHYLYYLLHDFNNISNRGETISDSFQFLY